MGNRLRRYRLELLTALSVGLMLAALWMSVLNAADSRRAQARQTAATRAHDTARLMELIWSEKAAHIRALHGLADQVARAVLAGQPPDPLIVNELRQIGVGRSLQVRQVASIDAAGFVIWTTLKMPDKPVNLSEREHFLAIARDGKDSFVGRPVVGAVSGTPTIQFAHAVRAPDGKLLAVNVVSVDADVSQAIEAEVGTAPDRITALIRNDGQMLARSTDPISPSAGTTINSSLFRRAVAEGNADGLLPGTVDGLDRYYALRVVPGTTLLVAVGINPQLSLSLADEQTRKDMRWAASLSAVLLALAGLAVFGWRVSRDARETRAREEALARRDALLENIAERATDIISLLDVDFNYLFVSPAMQTLLGADPADMLGKSVGYLADEGSRTAILLALTELAAKGGSARLEARKIRPDGTELWLETEYVAIPPGAHGPGQACYLSIARDITARKRTEMALQDTQQMLRVMQNSSGSLLYRLLPEVNGMRDAVIPGQMDQTFLGYTRAEMAEPGFLRRYISGAELTVFAAAANRAEQEGSASFEAPFPAKGGERCWLRLQMIADPNPGREGHVIVHISDITSEHAARQRLQHAERLAILGEVTSDIAHEMNQPLAAIAMAAENGLRRMERRGDTDEGVASKFQRILAQAHRVATVIDHIRDFSRLDSRRTTTVSIDDIIGDVEALAGPKLEGAGIVLVRDIAPNLPTISCQRVPLEQVVLNIVGNACDAYRDMPPMVAGEAPREIVVTARAEGDGILMRVRDRAGGISPEIIDRIFDPFFTTKEPGQGTGIGLSVSVATIAGMGGRLTARNEAGGAVFDILLPLEIAASPVMA